MSFNCDLLVIGGGPAGMAAATAATRLGLKTVLADQQPEPGGQIYRAAERHPHPLATALGKDYARGTALARDLRASGAELHFGSAAFDIDPAGWVGLVDTQDRARYIRPRRILVATGAMERPFPIPGWTLPGVMTVGAAQILLKQDFLVPEGAVLVGSGPLLLLLAAQLAAAGRAPQAFIDTTPRANYVAALRHLPGALRAHAQLRKGLAMMRALRRSSIDHISGAVALRIEGGERARAVTFSTGGRERSIEARLVLVHQGVVPNIQITRALRCDHLWDTTQLCWVPVTDRWGRTSQESIYCAGDGAGIAGAIAAELRGGLAALSAACDLGRITPQERDRQAAPVIKSLAREQALRPFLDALYRPADDLRMPIADATIVCRCEEVSAGEVRSAVRAGASGPNQLKAFLRAGMGPCQGRMCGLTVCEMIAQECGVPVGDVGYYRTRMPFRPLPLASYASMERPAEADENQPVARITSS